jgi:hypothetical protein
MPDGDRTDALPPSNAVIDPTTFTGIPTDRIMEFWDQAEPLLWRAILLTGGDETLLSVRNDLRNGERALWMAFTDPSMTTALMAVTTRIVTFGSGRRKCEICHIGGDEMRRWLGFLPLIEAWAREQGCCGMRLIGRRGWVKMLANFGYEDSAVVVEKAFDVPGSPRAV